MNHPDPSRLPPADSSRETGPRPTRRASAAPARRRGDGCGFLVFTCLVTSLLMVINGGLIAASYRWVAELGPNILQHPRVAQACLFLLPVVFLFAEWWLLDRFFDWLRPAGGSSRAAPRRRPRHRHVASKGPTAARQVMPQPDQFVPRQESVAQHARGNQQAKP